MKHDYALTEEKVRILYSDCIIRWTQAGQSHSGETAVQTDVVFDMDKLKNVEHHIINFLFHLPQGFFTKEGMKLREAINDERKRQWASGMFPVQCLFWMGEALGLVVPPEVKNLYPNDDIYRIEL